ncbi:ammonium transporter [Yoonia sediminilitoris]|uniref:Ammonium transporter n=1 Tax=Yoonia sediminilitoris TaxID=1286148 RepID=A0A2T6K889_9RHOB|nr:ammonium transporter [Yoonia sediminilitoris]PUB10908.1 Amt family ammonium transporter [Yoonia sediminilitoris]RCW90583.1 ammonium transporter [Yoonia sediminilitoris]
MSQIDLVWVLMCTALVFMMQAGFMCVEAGITRTKNNISVAIKNISDFSLSVMLFWLLGYGLMYGESFGGFIGTSGFAFDGLGDAEAYTLFLFQLVFCGTAATILSGAVAERCAFHAYLIITAITVALVYPLFGHWAWSTGPDGSPAGWLGKLGYYDFAGSSVVHAVGGGIALAAILVLGPREGRFLESGQARRFNGSNLPLTMLGVILIWFGWFGFNGGSELRLTNAVPGILLNTVVSGASGVLTGLAVSWMLEKKASVFHAMNGGLAGLVAITASCDLVSVREAVAIGSIGGLIALLGDRALERLHIDDVVGAVPVHFMGGLWGVMAVAFFGVNELETSFWSQFGMQVTGIAALIFLAVVLPFAAFLLIDRVMPLRVTQHVESIGLNVGEHGANTDLNELFEVMQRQARDRDLSIRAPQSPFTEVGQIGLFYNSVLFELERSFELVREQKNDLSEAIEQKSALLENILPKRIAERMNGGADQIVDQVTDATVVFVDIVDFTEYTASVPPEESLGLLRDLFRRFDGVIQEYDLEKIKTVGDSYMYVSGVTSDIPDHCAVALDAAVEILFETGQMGQSIGRKLQVRIGIHSGPLVAGVVGDLRFVYDLWGMTVNMASRIEEAGKPGKISVSQSVIDRIGNEFVYERQGRVRLKGIGPSVLYSIEGRRPGMARKVQRKSETGI